MGSVCESFRELKKELGKTTECLARKRFEKFGEKEAENHTWEAYQERRNEKLGDEKEEKLLLLKRVMESHPNATQKELAKMLGVTQKTISKWKNNR